MKPDFRKWTIVFLICSLFLIFFPPNRPIARANNFSVDLDFQIMMEGGNWHSDGVPLTVDVGTLLFYRVLGQSFNISDTMVTLANSLSPGITATVPVSPHLMPLPVFPQEIFGPVTATLGTHTESITGTWIGTIIMNTITATITGTVGTITASYTGVPSIPEPAALLLVAAGLMSIFGLRKKLRR